MTSSPSAGVSALSLNVKIALDPSATYYLSNYGGGQPSVSTLNLYTESGLSFPINYSAFSQMKISGYSGIMLTSGAVLLAQGISDNQSLPYALGLSPPATASNYGLSRYLQFLAVSTRGVFVGFYGSVAAGTALTKLAVTSLVGPADVPLHLEIGGTLGTAPFAAYAQLVDSFGNVYGSAYGGTSGKYQGTVKLGTSLTTDYNLQYANGDSVAHYFIVEASYAEPLAL